MLIISILLVFVWPIALSAQAVDRVIAPTMETAAAQVSRIVVEMPGPSQEAVENTSSRPDPLSIYVELWGNVSWGSINADYRFPSGLLLRTGLAHYSIDFFGETRAVLVPLMTGYLIGAGNHHIEVGAGLILGQVTHTDSRGILRRKSSGPWLTGTLGYRYQRPNGGFLFRAGVNPVYATGEVSTWGDASAWGNPIFVPGLSVGITLSP